MGSLQSNITNELKQRELKQREMITKEETNLIILSDTDNYR